MSDGLDEAARAGGQGGRRREAPQPARRWPGPGEPEAPRTPFSVLPFVPPDTACGGSAARAQSDPHTSTLAPASCGARGRTSTSTLPGQTLHAPRVPQNCPLCPARAAGAAGGLTTVLHCRSVTAPTPQCEPHRSMAIPVHPHLPPCVRCTHPTWVKGGD